MEPAFGAPRRFARAWAALIAALTAAPYVASFLLTPRGQTYAWMFPPYPADSEAYRAWSRQAYDGAWLFSLKFTSRPNRPSLFLPFFGAAGRLARLTGLDIGLVHLLLKTAGVALFFWAFHGFLKRLKLTPFQSMAASVFAGISAGAGGLAPLIFNGPVSRAWMPIDAWLVDSNTFWSLLWSPVYPFSLALMLLSVRLADQAFEDADARKAWLSGLCLCALAVVHPYPLAVLYPLLAVMCAVRRPPGALALSLRVAAASLPGAAYVAALSFLNPLVRVHNALGTGRSQALIPVLAGFGLPLALALAAGFADRPRFARRHWLPWAWLGLALALSYCPIWFRTKCLFGAHLPVCILAGAAAGDFFRLLPRKAAWAMVLLVALPFTHAARLADGFAEVAANPEGAYRLTGPMREALSWLESHSRRSDVVFATPPTSAKVCAYAGNTVFWGHWAQSVDQAEQADMLKTVLADDSWLPALARRTRFWAYGIDYVFLDGPWRERFASGPARALLAGAEGGDKVFENSEVTIYRRRRAAAGGAPLEKRSYQAVSSPSARGSPISRR